MHHRRRAASSPAASLMGGIIVLVLGLFNARTALDIHMHGHRVLARIASISHGARHQSSSTRVTFSTTGGAASECILSGALGDVGRPVWIRYLPTDPTRCTQDELARSLGSSLIFAGFGSIAIVASFLLYQRAKRGDSVR